jgi:hypothetical protein
VRGAEKIGASDATMVLTGYIDGVQRLVSYLDRYEHRA